MIAKLAMNFRADRGSHSRKNSDRSRVNWRDMRHVIGVAKQQLERVPPPRERDCRLSLASAEMEMILVARYRSIEWGQSGID